MALCFGCRLFVPLVSTEFLIENKDFNRGFNREFNRKMTDTSLVFDDRHHFSNLFSGL